MSPKAAFFSVESSRGKKVIAKLMEEFNGFIISDRYAAYNYFESSKRQICWAHLKRTLPSYRRNKRSSLP